MTQGLLHKSTPEFSPAWGGIDETNIAENFPDLTGSPTLILS